MSSTETAVFPELELIRGALFVLGGSIILALAFGARQRNYISHNDPLPSFGHQG